MEPLLEARFHVREWETTREIRAEELARRLCLSFASAVADPARGDAHVQDGLDRLIGLGAPEVILGSHRLYFGNVVFVSIREVHWAGAIATSYLHTMWPPLGDVVSFDVEGASDEAMRSLIVRELAAALDMESF